MTRLRHVDPDELAEKYNNAENDEEWSQVRQELREIDSGRWEELLDQAHKHLAHADLDSRDHLESLYSDEFLTWIGVYGLVQDLNTFEDLSGIERER